MQFKFDSLVNLAILRTNLSKLMISKDFKNNLSQEYLRNNYLLRISLEDYHQFICVYETTLSLKILKIIINTYEIL